MIPRIQAEVIGRYDWEKRDRSDQVTSESALLVAKRNVVSWISPPFASPLFLFLSLLAPPRLKITAPRLRRISGRYQLFRNCRLFYNSRKCTANNCRNGDVIVDHAVIYAHFRYLRVIDCCRALPVDGEARGKETADGRNNLSSESRLSGRIDNELIDIVCIHGAACVHRIERIRPVSSSEQC